MRPVLRQSLFVCLSLAVASAQGQSGDPSDAFLEAYLSFDKGKKLEESGNKKAAFDAYQQAVTLCDQLSRQSPGWNPALVENRRSKAAEKVAQLQPLVGKATTTRPDEDSLVGSLPTRTEEPIIPGTEAFVPPRKNTGAAAPKAPGNPLREVQDRLDNLEDELSKTKDRLGRVTKEKEDIAKKYEQALKSAAESAEKQIKIEKRANMLEDALLKAEQDGTQSSDATKEIRAEMDRLKLQMRDLKDDRDAETEIREQLAQSLSAARNRIANVTGERDTLKKNTAAVPERIAEMEKAIEKVLQEKGDLTVKLTRVQEQLGKVTTERDAAVQQVTKMREAQKQVDKLLADNTQLMAKLSDAETQIKTFKADGAEREKQIANLKTEMTGVKKQLADAQKQSATYQTQMADLQGKLDGQAKELTQLKTDATTTAAERKRLVEENEVLRGVVVRQMKQQAVRDKTKQLVLTELAKLEVNSKALLDQIEFLGQPVVKLTDREKKLFKQPTIEISDAEISIAAPKELTANVPVPAVPADAPPAEPKPVAEPIPAPESKPLAETKPATPPEVEPKPLADEKKLSLDTGVAPDAGVPGLDLTKPATGPSKTPGKATKNIKAATPLEDELPTKEPKLADAQPAAGGAKTDEPSTNIPGATPGTSAAKAPMPGATESAPSGETGSPAVPPELLAQAREAKEQFDKANYRDAEKIYEKILTKAPNNLYILSNLGVVRFRGGKLKLAEEAFKKAIAIAPEDAFSHCTLGIIYYSQQKYDEAVNELTKALAVNPKNATAHNYLGITASQKGWQEAAQKELETATALDPQYADAHFNLAVVFATQQPPSKESARRHYKLATELGAEPDSALEQLIK